eukprot:9485091-Pyramimonas_sp.AAC.2
MCASDWSAVRIYPRLLRLIGRRCDAGPAAAAVADGGVNGGKKPGENTPTLAASDWSAVRIYPRLLRLIGPP